MARLGQALLEHGDEIVQRWYEAWRSSPHPHHGVGELAIKDKLPVQLKVIGEQLQDLDRTLRMTIDPELFRDALGNLIDNAIKYTDSGFVCIEVEEQAEDVVFKITDSGPGIAPERKTVLFTPVRPQSGGGVGIGLTVVHRSVTAQGGAIGVESTPGKGSTFWFRLPRRVRRVDGNAD